MRMHAQVLTELVALAQLESGLSVGASAVARIQFKFVAKIWLSDKPSRHASSSLHEKLHRRVRNFTFLNCVHDEVLL